MTHTTRRVLVPLAGALLSTGTAHAQASAFRASMGGGAFDHDRSRPCVSDAQRAAIQREVDANVRRLTAEGKLPQPVNGGPPVLFDWPLQAAQGLPTPGYHATVNFVDHDPAYPNFLLDYACGPRSYDTGAGYNHGGIDYILWPFWWYKMDRDEVEILSAAAGTIVAKADGNFDQSCGFNYDMWNAVNVMHADGSVLWYGHMKSGSVTPKGVGESVAAGEVLGVVGSSGSSTAPHLHLELYNGGGAHNDPYAGACNGLNANSWWIDQRPYYDSAVNEIATHDAPMVFPACPAVEIPNYQNFFQAGDMPYFAVYYRDQLSGQVGDYRVIRPDDSIFSSWSHSSPEPHYWASYWYWWDTLPAAPQLGTWRFELDFEGTTTVHAFSVGPTFTATGACGSTVTLTATGATPFGNVAFAHGAVEGASAIPGGACAGTALGIEDPALVRLVAADASGTAQFSGVAPLGACGRVLQAVDLASCGVSPVRPVP